MRRQQNKASASSPPVCTMHADFALLPATALWGVGPRTAEKLAAMGIHTIGEIATWPAADLARRFGQHGEDLSRRARGVDTRPIVTERAAKSMR